jgi:hypothetical protein
MDMHARTPPASIYICPYKPCHAPDATQTRLRPAEVQHGSPGVNLCAYSAQTQATRRTLEKQMLLIAQGAGDTCHTEALRPGTSHVTLAQGHEPTIRVPDKCACWFAATTPMVDVKC